MFLKLYSANDDLALVEAFEKLQNVKWKCDKNKGQFRNDWDAAEDSLNFHIPAKQKRGILLTQLQQSADMKTEINRYINWDHNDRRNIYEFLRDLLEKYIRIDVERNNAAPNAIGGVIAAVREPKKKAKASAKRRVTVHIRAHTTPALPRTSPRALPLTSVAMKSRVVRPAWQLVLASVGTPAVMRADGLEATCALLGRTTLVQATMLLDWAMIRG